MMKLGWIVNPDHMSQAGVDDTLTLLETRHYSGVISPHGWMDPGNWPRLWKLGGMAFPGHSAAADYVKEWKKYRPEQTPYAFGWGYGADLGGLSHQPDPEQGDGQLKYPFKSIDGSVTFDRQKTGERTFDYNKDGVAHYGMYADWFADLRRLGGAQLASDRGNGGVASSARALRGVRSIGGGVRRRGVWVYAVRHGRVRAVGVASRKLSARTLRGDIRRLLAAEASRTPRKFVPSAAQAATRGRLTGHILAATGNPATTSALAALCSLQMQALVAR